MSDFITELREAGSPGFGTSAFMSTALSSGFYATTTYGAALDPRPHRILRCQRMYSWSFQASASCLSSCTRPSGAGWRRQCRAALRTKLRWPQTAGQNGRRRVANLFEPVRWVTAKHHHNGASHGPGDGLEGLSRPWRRQWCGHAVLNGSEVPEDLCFSVAREQEQAFQWSDSPIRYRA